MSFQPFASTLDCSIPDRNCSQESRYNVHWTSPKCD